MISGWLADMHGQVTRNSSTITLLSQQISSKQAPGAFRKETVPKGEATPVTFLYGYTSAQLAGGKRLKDKDTMKQDVCPHVLNCRTLSSKLLKKYNLKKMEMKNKNILQKLESLVEKLHTIHRRD